MAKYRGYAYVKDTQKRQRQRKRALIIIYLTDHPCVDCGESDPAVLDFDHVRGTKSFGIGQAASGSHRSWKKILIEIEKCDIRCANCHRRRHAIENNWYDFPDNILDDYISPKSGEETWHGTKNGYAYHKCRCSLCTEAQRVYQADYKSRKRNEAKLETPS